MTAVLAVLRDKRVLILLGGLIFALAAFLLATFAMNGAPGRIFAEGEKPATASDFGKNYMAMDFDQLVGLLVNEDGDGKVELNDKTPDDMRQRVMTEIVSMQLTSSLQPMPGPGDAEVTQAFQDSMNNMDRVRTALGVVKESTKVGGETRAIALEMHNFLGAVSEAMREIANQTQYVDPVQVAQELGLCQPDASGQCVPTDDIGDACPGTICDGTETDATKPIDATENANAVGTINPHFRVKPYFWKQVRSPYFIPFGSRVPQQDVRVTDAMALGECTAIMKEVEGMKVVVRPIYLGYWVEPWYARRHFVGTWVWVWEWLPAEVIKTISYCNNGNAAGQASIEMNVDIKVIPVPQLRDFWWFFPKDP